MAFAPSSSQINEASRMEPAIGCFVCGLCKFIVTPFPLECTGCSSLYCENCVKLQRSWSCTLPTCKSRQPPAKMHISVKEILELINFQCPGCKDKKRYVQFFDHVKTCEKIQSGDKMSAEEIQKIVSEN